MAQKKPGASVSKRSMMVLHGYRLFCRAWNSLSNGISHSVVPWRVPVLHAGEVVNPIGTIVVWRVCVGRKVYGGLTVWRV